MFTNNLLPTSYPCHLQIPRNGNPTHEDIGLFQYDDWEDMVEEESFEATYGCRNPGKVRGAPVPGGRPVRLSIRRRRPLYGIPRADPVQLKWALEAVNRAVAQGVVSGGDGTSCATRYWLPPSDLQRQHHRVQKARGELPQVRPRYEILGFVGVGYQLEREFLMRGDNLLWTWSKLTAAKQFVAQ
jgi:hypothetical protein